MWMRRWLKVDEDVRTARPKEKEKDKEVEPSNRGDRGRRWTREVQVADVEEPVEDPVEVARVESSSGAKGSKGGRDVRHPSAPNRGQPAPASKPAAQPNAEPSTPAASPSTPRSHSQPVVSTPASTPQPPSSPFSPGVPPPFYGYPSPAAYMGGPAVPMWSPEWSMPWMSNSWQPSGVWDENTRRQKPNGQGGQVPHAGRGGGRGSNTPRQPAPGQQ